MTASSYKSTDKATNKSIYGAKANQLVSIHDQNIVHKWVDN